MYIACLSVGHLLHDRRHLHNPEDARHAGHESIGGIGRSRYNGGIGAKQHYAQVLNYLKATGIKLGLLMNFGPQGLQYKRLIN